jgi:hypothetical protein
VTSFYIYKALNAMARGLGLVRNNGHLLAYQGVEKRGLSRIGPTDDGDESGTECHTSVAIAISRDAAAFAMSRSHCIDASGPSASATAAPICVV